MSEFPTAVVNGRVVGIDSEARTSLADFLRDSCNLTGTHLGCEHGVCGACTILVDDRPVRSCLTYAVQVEGCNVSTIEGLEDDEIMRRLREAFTEHHALQCGFCTPGMLISARDMIRRLGVISERRIREELAGNLCRCTGYAGIVAAIKEVSIQFPEPAPPTRRPDHAHVARLAVAAQNPRLPVNAANVNETSSDIRLDWMPKPGDFSVSQRFVTEHPIDDVWALFARPELVAANLPGAELTAQHGDRLEGRVGIKMGPIRAEFAGAAIYTRDEATRSGAVVGGGKDTLSGSRADGRLTFKLMANDQRSTQVDVKLDFALLGPLAQFSRAALVRDFTSYIISLFAKNISGMLEGAALRHSGVLELDQLCCGGFAGFSDRCLDRTTTKQIFWIFECSRARAGIASSLVPKTSVAPTAVAGICPQTSMLPTTMKPKVPRLKLQPTYSV
jgi:aerobic carbon-monoxide dehydrogenase small subunit